ncbi:aromatic ring-opening dioxygenase LigA [Microbacterium sp. DT81.1]|uniref:aromatic ring-opening dioxygenase LigA n=1 Tax=Microbacterium sp. DT81.1 TaxID=3393413 RepID=UPI003CF17973
MSETRSPGAVPAATADTVQAPTRSLGPVKVIGVLGMLGGIALVVVGIIVWVAVSTQLRAENITIPDDAMAFQGQMVQGPMTAYVQADIIQRHAMEASGGQTYAQLAQDDPIRDTMMNASFLRASLFTSVVSFGVAAFAIGVGILFILLGWALRRLADAPVVVKRSSVVGV